MNLPDQLLPTGVTWLASLLALALLAAAVWRAPWRRLAQPPLLNVWLGACAALLALWSIKTGIKPGLNFHVLGATLLTLMFGPALALAALALVVGGVTLAGHAGWSSLGPNWLVMAAVPVTVSTLILRAAERQLPPHLFVYIFINGFAGAALAMAACGLAATLLLALNGVYAAAYLQANYLPYFILMGWSEAVLTGGAVTLMVAYQPAWLATFSDARYLTRQK